MAWRKPACSHTALMAFFCMPTANGSLIAICSASASVAASSSARRHHAVHEPDAQRLLRVDAVLAGEQQLLRLARAEQPRHHHRHDAGAEADLGLAELRVVAAHGEVAHHHQVAPAGQAERVHLRDDRLRMVEELQHLVGRVLELLVPARPSPSCRRRRPRPGRSRRRRRGRRRAGSATRTFSSAAAASRAADIASISSPDSAFSAFGRFIVRRRTGPRSSVSRTGSAGDSATGIPLLAVRRVAARR